jgi:hypothetical protein
MRRAGLLLLKRRTRRAWGEWKAGQEEVEGGKGSLTIVRIYCLAYPRAELIAFRAASRHMMPVESVDYAYIISQCRPPCTSAPCMHRPAVLSVAHLYLPRAPE